MTTLAISNNNNSCLVSSRKRKRTSELHVRFCTQPQSIVYTWSQSDYDRSGLFPETTTMKKEDHQQFIFTLSINFIQQNQAQDIEEPEQHVFKKKSKLNRPKLSIDTSSLHGPLYFTNMTTNHQKKNEPIVVEEDPIDLVTKENTRRNSLPLILA
jgi:hypothetical protein